MTIGTNFVELSTAETEILKTATDIIFEVAKTGNSDAFKICAQLRTFVDVGLQNSSEGEKLIYNR